MIVKTFENPHDILERAGYKRRGSGRYHYIKYRLLESSKNRQYFHAIVNYQETSFKLHLDIHCGSETKHKTRQHGQRVSNEANRIKQQSFSFQLEKIAERYIKKLSNLLKV